MSNNEQEKNGQAPLRFFEDKPSEGFLILHADPDPGAREALSALLDGRVAAVLPASDGQEALFLFARTTPDLLVLDAGLPRLDAIQTAKAAREMDPNVPLLLTAAADDPELLKQAILVGVTRYLQKPFSADELRAAIDDCLRERTNRRAQAEERRLNRLMLGGLPFPALLLDRHAKTILSVNDQAHKFGLAPGQPCQGAFFPYEILFPAPSLDPWTSLSAVQAKAESAPAYSRYWDISLSAVTPSLMLLAAIDVSEAKRQALLRSDAERLVRHDLRTPLNSILAATEIILFKRETLPPSKIPYLEQIVLSGRRMLDLLNTSMSFARMEEGSYEMLPRPLHLLPLLNKVLAELEPLRRQKEVQLRIFYQGRRADLAEEGAGSFLIHGEAVLLESMFENLIKNAIEASPQGGEVRVSVSRELNCEIEIHNQGAIPEALRPIFFQRYASLGKQGGTGLGAYSARLIARTHGGDVSFTSSENHGVTLLVSLPCREAGE